MKSTLLVFILLIQTSVFGHDYFFSFAEVEYNPFTQKFETTLIVSAHDLEFAWKELNLSVDSLESYTSENPALKSVNDFITRSFVISSNAKTAQLSIVGIDVLLNGMIHFYLLSTPLEIQSSIDVRFDILMDEFPEQQNKLSFLNNGKTSVATFLPSQRTQRIILEN